ncbi:hypothetical protein C9F07_02785, partial [Salmonella enterica subsp. enterica serovar Poona]
RRRRQPRLARGAWARRCVEETAVTTTGGNAAATVATAGDKPVIGDMPAQTAPPTTANLNAWLNTFYAAEEKRKTTFPAQLPPDAQPFGLLGGGVCGLSWAGGGGAGGRSGAGGW